ncbi:MAG: PEGA domain-containing protein, partial [Planctomycetales bacterium]|nr:PEGA domain-containing protein [Planctomycetales bacterium]
AESQARPPSRRTGMLVACLLAAAGLTWAAGILLKVETKVGTIVLEINQPELAGAEVSVDDRKVITIRSGQGNEPIEVKADEVTHKLKVTKGGFEAFVTEFVVRAGKQQTIEVHLEPSETPSGPAAVESSQTWALEFDGVDDYVEVPGVACVPARPLTYEVWFTADPGEQKVESLISAFDMDQKCHVGLQLDRPKEAWYFSVGSDRLHTASHYWFTRSETPRTDLYRTRHHGALVWDGAEVHIYVDGKRQHSGATRLEIGDDFVPEQDLSKLLASAMLIGARLNVPAPDQFFKGRIDEVRISNVSRYSADFDPATRFVADEHTTALYHFDDGGGEGIFDSSGNGHHGEIHGAKWVSHPASPEDLEQQRKNDAVAQWVLSIGGWVATPDAKFEETQALKPGLTLVSVMLYANARVSNEDLGRLVELENLGVVALANTNISDAGMTHVAKIKTLVRLDVQSSGVTGKGLRELASLRSLKTLWANGLAVSNADIEYLSRCPQLEQLSLSDPAITDAAVEHFSKMKSLQTLTLSGTSVSAEGRANIQAAIQGCRVN